METTDLLARLGKLCSEVGYDLESADRALVERLAVLDAYSPVVADAERMCAQAFAVFRHYELTKPAHAFDSEERRVVVLACIFSDIGKTGPPLANAADRAQIAGMYAVEGVKNDSQTLKTFVRTYFPKEAEARVWRLEALDIDPEMSIRTFWNLHSRWSLEILQAARFPPEVVAAAATHHLLEDINPNAIVGADGRFAHSSGENHSFDRAEKLVIVLDKYDAARRRGRLTHDGAIAWVRGHVQTHPEFREDSELATLIADAAVALS